MYKYIWCKERNVKLLSSTVSLILNNCLNILILYFLHKYSLEYLSRQFSKWNSYSYSYLRLTYHHRDDKSSSLPNEKPSSKSQATCKCWEQKNSFYSAHLMLTVRRTDGWFGINVDKQLINSSEWKIGQGFVYMYVKWVLDSLIKSSFVRLTGSWHKRTIVFVCCKDTKWSKGRNIIRMLISKQEH